MIDTRPAPPAASNARPSGVRVVEHVTPDCSTVTSRPPTAIVPLLIVAAGFGSTLYSTEPLPAPAPPAVTLIHGTLGTAVQAHPPGAVTDTLALLPAATMLCETGVMLYVQDAPACVTMTACPATASVADRELEFGFASTV